MGQVIIEEGRRRDFQRSIACECLSRQSVVGDCRLRRSEQRQLLVCRNRSPGVAVAYAILLPQACDELCNALAVRRRQKRTVAIAFAIVLDELWEVLLEGRKKDCRRAGLQEKGSRKDVAGAPRRGPPHHHPPTPRRIPNAPPDTRRNHT